MFTIFYWQCFFICGEKDQFDRTSIELNEMLIRTNGTQFPPLSPAVSRLCSPHGAVRQQIITFL